MDIKKKGHSHQLLVFDTVKLQHQCFVHHHVGFFWNWKLPYGSKIGVIKSVKDESSCCDVIYCNLTG